MSVTDPASQSWHLDKRVPVALIFTILVQTAGFVYYMATLEGRVRANEVAIQSMAGIGDRTLRLEATVEFQNETLRRIETKVDRLNDKLTEKPERRE